MYYVVINTNNLKENTAEMRKQYDSEFKAKIALEAISGHSTIQEIAQRNKVHPNLISLWKQQILNKASLLFETNNKDDKTKELKEKEDMYLREIGHLQIEKEFLKKKYRELYGKEPQL